MQPKLRKLQTNSLRGLSEFEGTQSLDKIDIIATFKEIFEGGSSGKWFCLRTVVASTDMEGRVNPEGGLSGVCYSHNL